LDGIRVLDFTWFQQGPYATVVLSDFGAEIIKVEARAGGDPGRGIGPNASKGLRPYFIAHDRGKKSITLDVKQPEGREVALKLAERCDVLVHNFRPGVMERLGLDYATLKERNPRLVYAGASAFGAKGPRREQPGLDIAGQAMGGIMSVTGTAESGPLPAGAAIGDQVGAITLAYAILAALVGCERSGEGCQIDVSLYGSQIALQSWEITEHALTGKAPPPGGRGHPLLPTIWGRYDTADRPLVLGGVGDARWPGFATAIGRPELVEDPRFRTARDRFENLGALSAIVDECLATDTRAAWLAKFREVDLIAAPVQDYAEVVADEQAAVNGFIADLPQSDGATLRVVGSPVQVDGEPLSPRGPAPELGQHTEELLLELGYDWEAITSLREREVI